MSTRARWQSQNTQRTPLIYSTGFPSTENPISEGGRWTNGGSVGLDWQNVQTASGSPNKAYGTGTSTGYNDCISVLSGFPSNQSAQATIYRDPAYTAPDSHEIELLLRFKISANVARGYEVDFWFGGSIVQVFRWNGTLGDVTDLGGSGTGPGGLATGDIVKAQVVGSTITVYKNSSLIWTASDGTFTDGSPGQGFFIRPGGTPDRYCTTQYTASEI